MSQKLIMTGVLVALATAGSLGCGSSARSEPDAAEVADLVETLDGFEAIDEGEATDGKDAADEADAGDEVDAADLADIHPDADARDVEVAPPDEVGAEDVCQPDCKDRECGDDGCGGQCGECEEGYFCKLDGQAGSCAPECDTACGMEKLECGEPQGWPADTWGDETCDCGACDAGWLCQDGKCVCPGECEGKECGSDGCGGSCGQCGEAGTTCQDGKCVAGAALGQECAMTADCGGDTTCLLGFCTRVCRADGELIPAACDDVSEASPWGVDFGCAADFDYCLPAATGEEDAVCSSDDDCALPDAVCAGMFPAGDGGAFGVCLPSGVGKGAGAACAAAVECASKLCLATAQAPGGEGTCSRYCKADLDCPAGTLCAMAPLEEEGEALGFAALCQPLAGSLKPCESTADCKIGKETCTALVGPDGGATAPRCLASANPEGLWLGAACKEASDCFDPYCMFETWSANVEAYCTRTCQSDADCSPDTV